MKWAMVKAGYYVSDGTKTTRQVIEKVGHVWRARKHSRKTYYAGYYLTLKAAKAALAPKKSEEEE